MKTRLLFAALTLCSGLLLTCHPATAQERQTRLVVDNRTEYTAQIYVWRYNGVIWEWSYVTTVNAGYWTSVYRVRNNERYMAYLSEIKKYDYHTVRLYYDENYGGWQDIWWVRVPPE